jgi:hypothetical protein
MRFFCFAATSGNSATGKQKIMKRTNYSKREGSASKLKRQFKKLARAVLVRRWLILITLKVIGWLIERLWSDKDHHDLSP